MSHKQVLVLRKDLGMRKGKMVAQGAHASMAAILLEAVPGKGNTLCLNLDDPNLGPWLTGKFKKICVSVDSEAELDEIYARAKKEKIPCSLIIDSGMTEFSGVPTKTAVAVGPAPDEIVNRVTSHLKLL